MDYGPFGFMQFFQKDWNMYVVKCRQSLGNVIYTIWYQHSKFLRNKV